LEAWHTSWPLAGPPSGTQRVPEGQGTLHTAQFALSVWGSEQEPPQHSPITPEGVTQGVESGARRQVLGGVQWPPMQALPVAQIAPQAPQLSGSYRTLLHVPPQQLPRLGRPSESV
jgi:hypothetical protein